MENLANYRNGPSYVLATDAIAVGASKVFLDLWNGSTDNNLLVGGIFIVPQSDTAVTGALSARFDIFRSSSIGTGGTVNSYRSPAPNATTITPLDGSNPTLLDQGFTNEAIEAGITARTAPSAGATLKQWILPYYAFPEETSAQTVLQQSNNVISDLVNMQPLVIARQEGLVIKQGSVASVGAFHIVILFSLAGVPSV